VVGVGWTSARSLREVKRYASRTRRADDHIGNSDSFGSDLSSDTEMSDFAKNASVQASNKVQVSSGKECILYSSYAFFEDMFLC
jgi:hypothetical protein